MQHNTRYPKHTGNAIFASIGNGQVLDLVRERLTTISNYDLAQIVAEVQQQLQIREHAAFESNHEYHDLLAESFA